MTPKTVGGWRLLWPALLLSGAGYVGLALWFPLRPNLVRVPAADILDLADSLSSGLAYAGLLVLLFVLLVLAFRGIWLRGFWRSDMDRPPWHSLVVVIVITIFFGLPLLWIYPVNATDIFRYAQQGRISAVYGGNPFVEPLTDYPQDPFLPYAGEWAGETTPYGPVWETVGAVAARIAVAGGADTDIGTTLIVFKAVGLVTLILNATVLWVLLSRRPINQRAAFVVLLAWNPAFLLTFVAHGHNDGLMLFWLLLGLLALRREMPVTGLLLVVVAVLTKPVAALAFPIILLSALHNQSSAQARLKALAAVTLGTVVLVGLAFLPWARQGGWPAAPLGLAERLMREAIGGAGFSPATYVFFALDKIRSAGANRDNRPGIPGALCAVLCRPALAGLAGTIDAANSRRFVCGLYAASPEFSHLVRRVAVPIPDN